jgi:hypothetical protein
MHDIHTSNVYSREFHRWRSILLQVGTPAYRATQTARRYALESAQRGERVDIDRRYGRG